MTRYVALLRGINVGGNNKVPMASLKQAFEGMGYTQVSTYINSGNVLFSVPASTKVDVPHIEQVLTDTYGFAVRVVVRNEKNIQKLVQTIPSTWSNDTTQKTDVLFLWDTYNKKSTLDCVATNPAVDTLLYIEGALVWHIDRAAYTKSGMHTFVGTEVYKHMTARNINTVRALARLLSTQ
jgi:uncharacterized protein (DUF1697 family)